MIMDNTGFNMADVSVAGRMSDRLITIAEMLRGAEPGNIEAGEPVTGDSGIGNTNAENGLVVADVGCDHGYVSIYLLQSGIAKGAIAMDVRKGPLSGAFDNKDQTLRWVKRAVSWRSQYPYNRRNGRKAHDAYPGGGKS